MARLNIAFDRQLSYKQKDIYYFDFFFVKIGVFD